MSAHRHGSIQRDFLSLSRTSGRRQPGGGAVLANIIRRTSNRTCRRQRIADRGRRKGFRNEIFKLNTSYEVAAHTLVYLTWSRRLSPRGVNALPDRHVLFLRERVRCWTYKPDEGAISNSGVKGFHRHRRQLYADALPILWSNPQIEANTVVGGFGFVTTVSARIAAASRENLRQP